jgi:hypothetical protein
MSGETFIDCVYYYSLPEFPENCKIVNDNTLLIRDVLVCNPYNFHVNNGGQYDPHYEHELAPEYKMCSEKTRRKILSIKKLDSYENIYLLFRTGRASLDGTTTQYVSGYYYVDLEKSKINPNYEEPVIYAKEARFLNMDDAIDLSTFIAKSGNRRFPFSIEIDDGAYEGLLQNWTKKIKDDHNFFDQYLTVTKHLKKVFKYYEFEDSLYPLCDGCKETKSCPLAKRISKKGKLYHRLPKNIAAKINNHYKKTIKL